MAETETETDCCEAEADLEYECDAASYRGGLVATEHDFDIQQFNHTVVSEPVPISTTINVPSSGTEPTDDTPPAQYNYRHAGCSQMSGFLNQLAPTSQVRGTLRGTLRHSEGKPLSPILLVHQV